MNTPTAQTVLSGAAMVILGLLAGAMMFVPIPAVNAGPLNFILGALAGAVTVTGAAKLAVTNSTGPIAAVQPDAPQNPQPPTKE
ncbi:MAG TPA: hypothetical protein VGH15_05825 [Caulobacteraceae bacterium]|jgi:hypothetical protein